MPDYTKSRSGIYVPKSFSQVYEANRYSRKRRYMPIIQTDSEKVLTPHVLRNLRSSARQHYAQSGLVRGAFNDVARYLVGTDGIRPQSMCEDTGWARESEARWLNWLKIADIRRKLHMNQIVRGSSVEMDTDGDFGLIFTETGGGNEKGGMAQIQTVRAHRIDDADGESKSVAGVIKDKIGRVHSYRILEGEGKHRDIPAASMVLLGDPELTDFDRYPSAIAHGINIVVDTREIRDSVTMGVKSRTSRAMVIKTPDGTADVDDYDDPDDEGGSSSEDRLTLEEIQSGEILRLGPGEEIQDMSMDFPGGHVIPVMEFEYRDFAMGYGTPLEVIYKSDLGGPAQRFFLSKFQRRVDDRRSMVYIPMYFRLWGYFISKEMQRGALPYREDWWKVRFVPTSAKVTIDVGREAQQNREDMAFGNRSLEEDAGERGLDWEELRDQIEREAEDLVERAQALAKRKNIEFELALSLLSRRTPNGNLPTAPVEAKATAPAKE